MKECLFWRVIGVGVVVGLVSIGYGLCKNSPIPSPSFSSAAYADDTAPDVQTPLPEDLKAQTTEPLLNPVENAPLAPIPNPRRWERYVGRPRNVPPAPPAAQTAEPAAKPADDATPASATPTPASKSFKVTITIENEDGKKATIAGVQTINVAGQKLTFTDFSGKSTVSATRLSYDTSGKICIAADRLPFFPAALNRSLPETAPNAPPVPPAATPTPPADTVTKPIAKSLQFNLVNCGYTIERAKVPGGWLVMALDGSAKSITFYPDPEHKWDGTSIEDEK